MEKVVRYHHVEPPAGPRFADDPDNDGLAWQDPRRAALVGDVHAAVLFVVDRPALDSDHPVLVVDLSSQARPPFRCVATELWGVDNNLNIANMDWEEFADRVDTDGVFRGFD